GFWGGSPACAPPVPRVEVGPLRQTNPKAVAGRPRCATRGDFEVSVPEKSPPRCPRILAESGQEFIRVGKSLPLPLRRSNMGFQNRNGSPRRRLSGKDRSREGGRGNSASLPDRRQLRPILVMGPKPSWHGDRRLSGQPSWIPTATCCSVCLLCRRI